MHCLKTNQTKLTGQDFFFTLAEDWDRIGTGFFLWEWEEERIENPLPWHPLIPDPDKFFLEPSITTNSSLIVTFWWGNSVLTDIFLSSLDTFGFVLKTNRAIGCTVQNFTWYLLANEIWSLFWLEWMSYTQERDDRRKNRQQNVRDRKQGCYGLIIARIVKSTITGSCISHTLLQIVCGVLVKVFKKTSSR